MNYEKTVFDEETSGLHRWRVLVLLLLVGSGLFYLTWRVTVFNPEHPLFSSFLLVAEALGFGVGLLRITISWRMRRRPRPAAPAGKTVDVFITVYNEPLDVVRRTVVGATAIRYPHVTWLLDDGHREDFRALAAEFGCGYLRRTDRIGAKAGNLNNGLRHASGEFFLLLDADHVPDPEILDRLLGYFDDSGLAFVQSPQDYYNTGSFQHPDTPGGWNIWHEQSNFHYVGQPGRDYWGAATLCGCSALMRRSMVDEVGGFPTATVTEDMHCAVKLQKRGYRTAYHAEPLAFGIAPADLHGFLRQRLRWGEGNLQVCREEGLPFSRQLSLMHRLCYYSLTSNYLEGWLRPVYYLTPLYTLFTGHLPMQASLASFALHFLPFFLLSQLYAELFGRGFGRFFTTETFAMARFVVNLQATFGLFRKRIQFRVSSKLLNGRMGLRQLLPQAAIGAACIVALLYAGGRLLWAPEGYVPWETAVVLLVWVIVDLALVAGVFRLARRSAGSSEELAFDFPLPLLLARGGQEEVVTGIRLNADTLVCQSGRSGWKAGERFAGRLIFPQQALAFQAEVMQAESAGQGQQLTLALCWSDVATRDALEQNLISQRWQRFYKDQTEKAGSWLGHLYRRLRRLPLAQPWEPVLLAADRNAAPQGLGFLRATPAGHELVTFNDVPDELWTLDRRGERQRVSVAPLSWQEGNQIDVGFLLRSRRFRAQLAVAIQPGSLPDRINNYSQGEPIHEGKTNPAGTCPAVPDAGPACR
jgi:cellulose synthase (UDP-forming)